MDLPSHVCYRKHKILDEMEAEDTIEDISESVDDLRERLTNVKRLMMEQSGYTLGDLGTKKTRVRSDVIDGNFLSFIFMCVLTVVISASAWAFYNLYRAVLMKFPSHHTEL
ncbi:hypothetical protein PV326_008843 [Microctonus aethiopoides]|uniref:Uncharacterized protein n=1 Tax=Microctonus aethiopoides TaxID=144406 RepID=A0AA39KM77_9HYME|nr:hypothetical protein PV326_008843 [Microctonus aethiopoides]KAK0166481.1 hypothetical protein PV328_004900 [Microctonus aethiopoides]